MAAADNAGNGKGYQDVRVKTSMPLTGMRKAIAEHMLLSKSTSAQVTVMGEMDMAEMIDLRSGLVAQEAKLGTKITYSDILIYIVARMLKKYPLINASIIGGEVKVWEDINISVAISLKEGLIAPVIRNADTKSLVAISKELKELARAARDRTITIDKIDGGTFTISNLGSVGSGWRFDTIIINPPQSAILAVGGITDRALIKKGEVVAGRVMTYMLTYDHRLLDGGGIITSFINEMTSVIENPWEHVTIITD